LGSHFKVPYPMPYPNREFKIEFLSFSCFCEITKKQWQLRRFW
jgi:hypothetical protein